LPRLLASIKPLADEIVVVDMESSDGTLAIAEKAGAKVFFHKPVGYVEPARNFAVGKATGDWILILDADEELPKSLAAKLKKISQKPNADYFRIPRKNIVFGKWLKHSRWWPDLNIRFFKKGHVSWNEVIHSVPMTQGKGVDLPEKEEFAIIHHNYDSIEQYLERMNRYTDIQSQLLIKAKHRFIWKDIITKPLGEFLSRYFHGEGYKDGLHGLALSGLQAFSEFILYLKIWQMSKFPESRIGIEDVVSKMKESESDLHFWQSDALLKEVGGLKHRIKRKFRLS